MKKSYRSHFLGWELVFSLLLTVVIIFLVHKYLGVNVLQNKLTEVRDELYGTLAALSGALLGFVITGLSVLLTTGTNKQMNTLKKSKHYKTVFEIFFSTSKYLGLLLVFSLISLIFDKDSAPVIELTVITLWALIIVSFRILRCLWVLKKIVHLHVIGK